MNDKIKVVLCEIRKNAEIAEIGAHLEDMQKVVDGYIERFNFSGDDNVCIICNEEAKYFDDPLNRSVNDWIIAGTFFVCGFDGDKFVSLTDEQAGSRQ